MLKPGGLVLNHGITHNSLDADSLGSGIGDFVEDYVFPGGELTHVSRVIEGMAREGLESVDAEALREHYAKTLWHWVDRLEAHEDGAREPRSATSATGSGASTWRGRRTRSTAAGCRCGKLLAGKPHADGRLPHPLTREYMYRRLKAAGRLRRTPPPAYCTASPAGARDCPGRRAP